MCMLGNMHLSTKMHFPCHTCGLDIFQNNSHNSYLGRSSDECIEISVLTPILSSQEMLVFRHTTSLGHINDVTVDDNHMLYFVLAT